MPVKVEHRIGIRATPEEIWPFIADLSEWGDWNPLYTRAVGALRIGGRLELDLSLPGRRVQTIRPVILDWIPNEQIHWRLTALGGLVRTTRYIEIEALETGSIFSNGELFDGPLAGLAIGPLRQAVRQGFRAMGEAVRDRVEAALAVSAG